jgi:hypothetical protein
MVSTSPPESYNGVMDPTEAGAIATTTTMDENQSRKRKQAELEQQANTSTGDANTLEESEKMIHTIVSKLLWSDEDESSSEEQVTEAMESLCALVTASSNDNFDEHRKTAFHLGAPLAIVKAMSRNSLKNSPKIQKDGCSILAALCFHKLNDTRLHIIEIGGLTCSLEALQRFPADVDVQVSGCNLIGSLWLRPDVRKRVVETGGLQAVLHAMARHKRAELVQSVGCKALFTLLRLESNGSSCWDKKAVDDGCIRAVIAAMANHLTVADLQIAACQFLIILAKRSEHYRDEIIQAKGLVAAGEARRLHKDNARVVCVARNAIRAING